MRFESMPKPKQTVEGKLAEAEKYDQNYPSGSPARGAEYARVAREAAATGDINLALSAIERMDSPFRKASGYVEIAKHTGETGWLERARAEREGIKTPEALAQLDTLIENIETQMRGKMVGER